MVLISCPLDTSLEDLWSPMVNEHIDPELCLKFHVSPMIACMPIPRALRVPVTTYLT